MIVSTEACNKDVRDFEINATTALTVDADPFTWQVQVGSRRYPDFPVQGVAESYYRLMQAVGVAGNLEDTTLTPAAYIENKGGILGINFEKLGDQAAFSGINTQGQVMTLTLNNAWVGPQTSMLVAFLISGIRSHSEHPGFCWWR